MSWVLCNKRECTPVVEWCLNDVLHMSHYELNVNYQTINRCGGYFERPNLVFIGHAYNSFGQDYHQEFRTLFHELRHYYQYMTKMFDFNYAAHDYDIPKDADDQAKYLIRYFSYLNYPWELDAQEFSMETMRQFFKTPFYEPYKPKPIPPFIPSTIDFIVNPTQADPSYPTFSGI